MNDTPTSLLRTANTAHAHFLEQLNDEEFWEYAFEVARPITQQPVPREDYLVCEIESERCLLSLTTLLEVLAAPTHVTQLPASPPWMLGILAWRGETIAIIDLAAYLADVPYRVRPEGTLLITRTDTFMLGLIVPSIDRTLLTSSPGAHNASEQEQEYQGLVLDMNALLYDVIQYIKSYAL